MFLTEEATILYIIADHLNDSFRYYEFIAIKDGVYLLTNHNYQILGRGTSIEELLEKHAVWAGRELKLIKIN